MSQNLFPPPPQTFSKVFSTVPFKEYFCTRALTFQNLCFDVWQHQLAHSRGQAPWCLRGNTFSKVLYIVTLYSEYTRALICANFS
jgi:hypothetical protein